MIKRVCVVESSLSARRHGMMRKEGDEEFDLKRWIDCVKEMAVSDEMMSDRGEWRKWTCCADPKWTGKRAGRSTEINSLITHHTVLAEDQRWLVYHL
jgi:hypothetical protein